MTDLCSIDTETGSLRADREAWEVAIIRRDTNGLETRFHAFLAIDLSRADPYALQVGGYFDRHPWGRVLSGKTRAGSGEEMLSLRTIAAPRTAATEIVKFTHGAHIVGVNPGFDTATLEPLLRRHGLSATWHYHLIDVPTLALGWLNGRHQTEATFGSATAGPILPPWKSDDLAAMCGVEPATEAARHTAMGDAEWAMRWYDAVMGVAA